MALKTKNQNSYYKLTVLDNLELLDAKNYTHSFPFHTHPTYNITLVLEQTFDTKINNQTFHALPGSIVITNPNEVHATVCDAITGSSFFTFYVSPDILSGLNNGVPVFFADKIIDDSTLFRKLMQISARLNAGDNTAEEVFLVLLQQLITGYSINNLSLSKKQQLFQRFLNEENMENFSLTETARQFGLDKYKFLRLFKQETGLTPNNYIILKRIEKCKSLLHTNDDLLDIAIQTGFYDATHLCRHFKRITGVTPQTYREA